MGRKKERKWAQNSLRLQFRSNFMPFIFLWACKLDLSTLISTLEAYLSSGYEYSDCEWAAVWLSVSVIWGVWVWVWPAGCECDGLSVSVMGWVWVWSRGSSLISAWKPNFCPRSVHSSSVIFHMYSWPEALHSVRVYSIDSSTPSQAWQIPRCSHVGMLAQYLPHL